MRSPPTWRELLDRVPREIRLEGYVGPTLFTSASHGGELVTLEAFHPAARTSRHAGWRVFGTQYETQFEPRAVVAFCLEPDEDSVACAVLHPPFRASFTNSSPLQFLDCLRAFAAAWPFEDATEPALRSKLADIDPEAMGDGDHFWPEALESFFGP